MRRTSRVVVASLGTGGLLLCLTAGPAAARPGPCPANAEPVAVEDVNEEYEGPLWAPFDQAAIEQMDRNGDGLLCVHLVYTPSEPPSLEIPPGETNVWVQVKDNPRGLR